MLNATKTKGQKETEGELSTANIHLPWKKYTTLLVKFSDQDEEVNRQMNVW